MHRVNPAIRLLAVDTLPKNYVDRIRIPLGFFQLFFSGLPCLNDCCLNDSREHDCAPNSATMMMRNFDEKADEFKVADEMANWEQMCCDLEEMMEQCKPEVNQICIHFLKNASDFSYKCKSTQLHSQELIAEYGLETIAFIGLIKRSLGKLEDSTHLSALSEKLKLFETFVKMAKKLPADQVRSGELLIHARVWANQISHLICFYWTAEKDDSLAATTAIILSDLMKRYVYTPQAVALYLDVLVAFGYEEYWSWGHPDIVVSYVGFLLEHLVSSGNETLQEGLVFLLSFVMDTETPNYKSSEERDGVVMEAYDILMTEVPSVICIPDTDLSAFLHRTEMVKIKVRDLYAFTPLPPPFHPSQAKGIGILDFYLASLQGMLNKEGYYIPSIKNCIDLVEEDLASLRSFFQLMLELEKEREDIWIQVVNVAYLAGYVAHYCHSERLLVWYGILYLPPLIEEIHLVKSKVREIENGVFLPKASASGTGELFIGFQEDEKEILRQVISISKKLKFISITGMGGQGKTAMARRIFNHHSFHYHFVEKVWCYVSKECNLGKILVSIARDLGCDTDVKIERLIEYINCRLKGKRYLIVLDDVWDVDLGKEVQSAFPNDKNGSAILITSRNGDMAWEFKLNYDQACAGSMRLYYEKWNPRNSVTDKFTHKLRFFTDEESWQLIRENIFGHSECPLDLLRIGKDIAVSCKGLPLAAALVTAVLQRRGRVLELWEEVAKNLIAHLASEGFRDIVGLSYDSLPEYLKPCFLYFGSFPRGHNISVYKLNFLWVAEGLVKENLMDSLTKNYLDDLISHNLVTSVAERRSTKKMKSCKVHELLYDICLDKAVQDNFLQLVDGSSIMGECYSNPQKYEFQFQRRICIHQAGSFTSPKSVCSTEQLSASRVHSILCSGYCPDMRQPLSSFLSRFKVLTTLDLEDMYLIVFPLVILQNVHLRYLALRGLIEHIPPSIADLRDLKTVIVKRASQSSVVLPDTFWVKTSLNYVHIDRIRLPSQNDESESYSAAASQIVVLGGIVFEYGVKMEQFMRRLTSLRKLKFYYINGVLDPMWFGCLENLVSVHVRNYYGLMLPDQPLPAFNFPKYLKKLVIEGCRLPWSVMSTVGSLSRLEVLKLRKWALVGPTWHLRDGEFKALNHLELFDLDVEQIDDSACKTVQTFMCLKKLCLIQCVGLESIPSFVRRAYMLETIDVSGSSMASEAVRQFTETRNPPVSILGLED